MKQLHVEADGTARADPATVWALISDATRYPEWARGALRSTSVLVTPRRAAPAPSTGCGLPGVRISAT
jgi:hypothetical protein